MQNKEKSHPIFVTGGTGFLGSYLLRWLVQKGYSNIRALHRSSSTFDLVDVVKDKIQWIEGDLLDSFSLEKGMRQNAMVYHCAGIVSYAPSDFQKMMDINAEGTANVVNIALQQEVKKFVHVSSIAAIGRRPKLKYINENTKWERSNWNSQYAISKHQAEMEVWRGIQEGLTAAIVNPSIIVGGGYWNSGTGQLFQRAYNRLKFYPNGTTGYVDVRDVAQFMVLLMKSDIVSERFVLNGTNVSYLDFFTRVATVLGKQPPSIAINTLLKEVAIAGEWIRSTITRSKPLLTRQTVNHVERSFIYENEKSKKAFDFEYRPLQTTIEETATAFLESKKRDSSFGILEI